MSARKLRVLAGGAAIALLAAGCGYDDPYYYSEPYYTTSSYYYYYPDRHTFRVMPNARVTGIDLVGSSAPVVRPGEQYRVTVRHPDGRLETYVMSSLGSVRVGDVVRIENGRIYPIG